MAGLNLRLVVCSRTCRITSGSQVIPNMALTVTIIKVTRFRTFNTPCMKKHKTIAGYFKVCWSKKNFVVGQRGHSLTGIALTVQRKNYLSYVGSTRLSRAIRPSLSINYVAKKIWKSDHHSCIR